MIKGRTGSYGVADIWSNVVVSPTAYAYFSQVSTEAMTTRASTASSSIPTSATRAKNIDHATATKYAINDLGEI